MYSIQNNCPYPVMICYNRQPRYQLEPHHGRQRVECAPGIEISATRNGEPEQPIRYQNQPLLIVINENGRPFILAQ